MSSSTLNIKYIREGKLKTMSRETKKNIIIIAILFSLVIVAAIGTIEYANYVINYRVHRVKVVPYPY
jgi:hypothetical protein